MYQRLAPIHAGSSEKDCEVFESAKSSEPMPSPNTSDCRTSSVPNALMIGFRRTGGARAAAGASGAGMMGAVVDLEAVSIAR